MYWFWYAMVAFKFLSALTALLILIIPTVHGSLSPVSTSQQTFLPFSDLVSPGESDNGSMHASYDAKDKLARSVPAPVDDEWWIQGSSTLASSGYIS